MRTKMHCKSIFALLLAVVMVLSMIPATALTVRADDVPEDGVTYLINTDFDDVAEMGTSGYDKWCAPADNREIVTDGDVTALNVKGAQLHYMFTDKITGDYVIKFRYKLDGIKVDGTTATEERFNFQVGSGGADSSSQIYCQLVYVANNERIQVFDSGSTPNYYASQSGGWHEVEIHVNRSAKTYQLFGDGVQFSGASGKNISYYKDITTTSFIRFFPNGSNANFNLYLDYFQVYTEDWTVNQQVSLGGKLGYTFSGNVNSNSGITGVRATLGDTTVDATLADGAYSVTVPVAASQMGETVTLEAMAGDTVKYRKEYAMQEYLNALKAADTNAADIANHTLNYGSAAAAYFNGTAVTAPSLSLTDVPNPASEGVDVSITDGTGVYGLWYALPEKVEGDYTLEFDYCVADNKVGYVKTLVIHGNSSDLELVYLTLRGGGDSGDRVQADGKTMIYSPAASGGWHKVKVVVHQTDSADTYTLYLDGTQQDGTFSCRKNKSGTQYIYFGGDNSTTGSIQVDNVKFTQGDTTVLLDEDFSDFTYETTSGPAVAGSANSWYVVPNTNVTYNMKLTNPVSGTCDGVTVNSANLLFEDQVKIRYKITLDEGKSINDYTVLVDGQEPANVVSAGGNTYYIYSEGINPQMYAADVVLTVSDGTDTVTVSYSPLDYIQRMYEKDSTTENLKTLLKAMYNYYLAAVEYVANS